MKNKGLQQRKSNKIRKFPRKKGKNSPSGKKGLLKKKKEGGKKGTFKNVPFEKKGAHQKKKTKG